jgi:hypothetical protein
MMINFSCRPLFFFQIATGVCDVPFGEVCFISFQYRYSSNANRVTDPTGDMRGLLVSVLSFFFFSFVFVAVGFVEESYP